MAFPQLLAGDRRAVALVFKYHLGGGEDDVPIHEQEDIPGGVAVELGKIAWRDGGYEHRPAAFDRLGENIRKLGLEPTGYVRAPGLVAPTPAG